MTDRTQEFYDRPSTTYPLGVIHKLHEQSGVKGGIEDFEKFILIMIYE